MANERECGTSDGLASNCSRTSKFGQIRIRAHLDMMGPEPRVAVGEQIFCSLMLLQFVPMRSGSQQCVNVVQRWHGDNTGSNPVGDAKYSQHLMSSLSAASCAHGGGLVATQGSFAASRKTVFSTQLPNCR